MASEPGRGGRSKRSALGVAALVAGVLVGALVAYAVLGGGEDTTTVIQQAPPATETTSDGATTETTSAVPPVDESLSLSELAEEQRLTEADSVNFRAASQLEDPVALQGEELTDPALVVLGTDIHETSLSGPPWQLEVPVSGFSRLQIPSAGMSPTTPSDTEFELAIYADEVEGEPIWGPELFEGPATVEKIDADLEGTSTLIFDWSSELWGGTPEKWKFSTNNVEFVLGDATLSQGE